MSRRRIEVEAESAGSPTAAYELLADHSTWASWSAIDSVSLEREGEPPPDGVGAIRINVRGRTTGRDQITRLEPGRRFEYISLSGLPVEDYRASVELADGPGGGTLIRWQASFDPKYPGTGWILERGIRSFLRECAEGLAAAAAQGG